MIRKIILSFSKTKLKPTDRLAKNCILSLDKTMDENPLCSKIKKSK